jgi:hypothetical protein
MKTQAWFDDLSVIGNLPIDTAIMKLREVGEDEVAAQLDEMQRKTVRGSEPSKKSWPFQDKPWQHTSHTYGYIAPISSYRSSQTISAIDAISPDESLRDARIKVTLNRLRVASYPGGGTHRILLHFAAQNQAVDQIEAVHFNATYRVREGDSAGVQGYPIFVGLGVGHEGIVLQCRTINVHNDQDEAFLRIVEAETFKAGLRLASIAQPAIVPLSEMALGFAKVIATRNRNLSVQDFGLGLDFSTIAGRGRLAEGAYLAVQKPESIPWDWTEWIYLSARGQVVHRNDYQKLIPYNYLVFGISRC